MPRETFTVVQCPQCKQSLPASAPRCHFCGTMLSGQPTGTAAPRAMAGVTILSGQGQQSRDFTTWQDKAYRICCYFMLLMGVVNILQGMNVIPTPARDQTLIGVQGAIQAFFALMLLWEQTWAQFIMKWALVLNVVVGVLNCLQWTLLFSVRPALAALFLVKSLLEVGLSSLMLYLIHTSGDA